MYVRNLLIFSHIFSFDFSNVNAFLDCLYDVMTEVCGEAAGRWIRNFLYLSYKMMLDIFHCDEEAVSEHNAHSHVHASKRTISINEIIFFLFKRLFGTKDEFLRHI